MPPALVNSFAQRTGNTIDRVERLWDKTKQLVKDQYDLSEPGSDADEDEKDRYYRLRTGILKRMVKVGEDDDIESLHAIADSLERIGLHEDADRLRMFGVDDDE